MVRKVSAVVQLNNNINGKINNSGSRHIVVPIHESRRTFLAEDQSTGQWIFQTIHRNDNNWLLAIALSLNDVYTRKQSVCRIDCGDGKGIIVMFGNNNDHDHDEQQTYDDFPASIPSVTVIAGIMATIHPMGGDQHHNDMLQSSSFGVINPHECLYDHFVSLLEMGHKGTELLIQLDVETRPPLLGSWTTSTTTTSSNDKSPTAPKYHVVRILGTETSWDDCFTTLEIVRNAAITNNNKNNTSHPANDENSETTFREANTNTKPLPAKRTRSRNNTKAAATAQLEPTFAVASPTSTRRSRKASPSADLPPVTKDPPPTDPAPSIAETNRNKTLATIKPAVAENKNGTDDPPITADASIKPPPTKRTRTNQNSNTSSSAKSLPTAVDPDLKPPPSSTSNASSIKKAPQTDTPAENPDSIISPADSNARTTRKKSTAFHEEDDSKSLVSDRHRQRKARKCCYAPFCTKLAIECGGFMRGKCSEVLDGRITLPSEKELTAAKLELKRATKSEGRRRALLNNTSHTGTTTTNDKPSSQQPSSFIANEQETPGQAFPDSAAKAGGPLSKNGIASSQQKEDSAAAFNPKEFVLLGKAFKGTLSKSDGKDKADKVHKKDIQAAVTLFKSIEQEKTATVSLTAMSELAEMKKSPEETLTQSPLTVPTPVVTKEPTTTVDDVGSPAPTERKKDRSASSLKKSKKKKKNKKDKKRKRDRESRDEGNPEISD